MTSDKRVLFILGSHDKLLDGSPTGWFLPEAAHPYWIVSKEYQVDFASIKGGEAPLDPSSVEMFKDDEESQRFLKDDTAQKLVKNTLKTSDIDPADYAAVFGTLSPLLHIPGASNTQKFVGGHPPIWEADNATNVKLYEDFWNSGKLVSAVCHGPAALTQVKDKDGELILAGRRSTGFTNAEEIQAKKDKVMPWLLEDRVKELGGKFEKAKEPWGAHVVQEGNLLSGQNPASAAGVGEHIVKWLKAQ